jgi:hypothetical protein
MSRSEASEGDDSRAQVVRCTLHFGECCPANLQRIIPSDRRSGQVAAENRDEDKVVPDFALRALVQGIDHGQNVKDFGLYGGFFPQLAERCGGNGFAEFDLTPGKAPKTCIRRVRPTNQETGLSPQYNGENGRDGEGGLAMHGQAVVLIELFGKRRSAGRP